MNNEQWGELNDQEKQSFQQTIGKNYNKEGEHPSRADALVFVGKTVPGFEAVKPATNGSPFNEQGYSDEELWEMVKSSLRNK